MLASNNFAREENNWILVSSVEDGLYGSRGLLQGALDLIKKKHVIYSDIYITTAKT